MLDNLDIKKNEKWYLNLLKRNWYSKQTFEKKLKLIKIILSKFKTCIFIKEVTIWSKYHDSIGIDEIRLVECN